MGNDNFMKLCATAVALGGQRIVDEAGALILSFAPPVPSGCGSYALASLCRIGSWLVTYKDGNGGELSVYEQVEDLGGRGKSWGPQITATRDAVFSACSEPQRVRLKFQPSMGPPEKARSRFENITDTVGWHVELVLNNPGNLRVKVSAAERKNKAELTDFVETNSREMMKAAMDFMKTVNLDAFPWAAVPELKKLMMELRQAVNRGRGLPEHAPDAEPNISLSHGKS